jgi:hypothetical protein
MTAELMTRTPSLRPDARYEGIESGQVLTYRQIGYTGAKTTVPVKRSYRGFIVDGEFFVQVAGE